MILLIAGKRGRIVLGVVAAFGLLAAALLWPGKPADPLVLRLGHYADENHPAHSAALQFAEAVERRSDGRIRVEVYADNLLGNPPELLEQSIAGLIDMSLPTQGSLDKYSRKFAVVMLPFVFRDAAHAHAVLDGPFMEWASPDLEYHGLVYLSNWEWGFRHLTNAVRPVNGPDDVSGLRIRTPPEIQLRATMEALGAEVISVPFPGLYSALESGQIDGQENPLSVIYHNRLYEVQPHLALTRHVYGSMVHVMGARTWARIAPADRLVIREESQRAGQTMRATIAAEEAELVFRLESLGMLITHPPLEDFLPAIEQAHARINAYAGNDFVATFKRMLEQE